jgi:flagellar motor switch/type III secretory pathway protein FliN
VREWEGAWLRTPGIEVECLAASDPSAGQAGGQWTSHRTSQGGLLWSYRQADLGKQIERLLFELDDTLRSTDRHRESQIAVSVAEDALDDLLARVLDGLAGTSISQAEPEARPQAWQFHRHSGSALLKLTIGGKALCLLVPNEQLPSRANPLKPPVRTPLAPLPLALTDIEVRLRAELGDVEMSLGHLVSLQLGDVIALPIGIDQTLNIKTENGHLIGVANLGKQDGNRAVEIFKTQ